MNNNCHNPHYFFEFPNLAHLALCESIFHRSCILPHSICQTQSSLKIHHSILLCFSMRLWWDFVQYLAIQIRLKIQLSAYSFIVLMGEIVVIISTKLTFVLQLVIKWLVVTICRIWHFISRSFPITINSNSTLKDRMTIITTIFTKWELTWPLLNLSSKVSRKFVVFLESLPLIVFHCLASPFLSHIVLLQLFYFPPKFSQLLFKLILLK